MSEPLSAKEKANGSFYRKDIVQVVKDIKELLKTRRQRVNEGIHDERLLAHLHTFINHFENGLDEILGDFNNSKGGDD